MKMPRRQRPAIMVPTASMGDIAFLLTIFFLICSNFAKEANLKINPPKSAEVRALKEGRQAVAIDARGRIHLQGREVSDAAYLEQELSARLEGKTTEEGRLVTFKCDQGVDKSVFEPVLDAIARAGGIIVAVGEKPPPARQP